MIESIDKLQVSVIQYCAEIGNDPLLVQGAGGNVSWKDGETLWIKASGTWLSEATEKEIFVPVDLTALQKAISLGDFSITPRLTRFSDLKPSIETMLHALMPHQVVVHLHAIEILAHLVRNNCENELAQLLKSSVPWIFVDYYKPGPELAAAVNTALIEKIDAKVIFLKNHGIVIGGSDINEIRAILNSVTTLLSSDTREKVDITPPDLIIDEYVCINDQVIQRLAFDTRLFDRLNTDWALYPDHVVFLGPKANTYESWGELKKAISSESEMQELVFVRGKGVFVKSTFSKAKLAQLRCYYDVLVRQAHDTKLESLPSDQIADLLNWDAEKYRMHISK